MYDGIDTFALGVMFGAFVFVVVAAEFIIFGWIRRKFWHWVDRKMRR